MCMEFRLVEQVSVPDALVYCAVRWAGDQVALKKTTRIWGGPGLMSVDRCWLTGLKLKCSLPCLHCYDFLCLQLCILKLRGAVLFQKKKLDEPCSYRYWIFSFHGRGEQKAIIATTTHYEVHLNVLCYLYMRLYLEDSITNYLENSINRYFLLRWMKERRDSPTAATAAAKGYNKNWKNISF